MNNEEIDENEMRLPQYRVEKKKFSVFVNQGNGEINKTQNEEKTLFEISANSLRQFKSDIKFHINNMFLDVTENKAKTEQLKKSWRQVRKANFFYTINKDNDVTIIYSYDQHIEFMNSQEMHGPFSSESRARIHYEDTFMADERRIVIHNMLSTELAFYCANGMQTRAQVQEQRARLHGDE